MTAPYDLSGLMLSVLARDPARGGLGIALASSAVAIGARCQHLAPGKAVVASQGYTNLKVGGLALDLIERGLTGSEVLGALRQHDRWMAWRQIAIVPREGAVEAHTGEHTHGWAGQVIGPDFACLGNGLPGAEVLHAMREGLLEQPERPLEERLLGSLEQVRRMLGPQARMVSSSLQVRAQSAGVPVDLRVDLARRPAGCAVAELRDLVEMYRPLALVYEERSRAPHRAPGAV